MSKIFALNAALWYSEAASEENQRGFHGRPHYTVSNSGLMARLRSFWTLSLRVSRPLSQCRDAIEPLNSGLEECLGLLRKCATIGVVEKMFDKGETKGNLEAALKRLNSAFQLFSMWLNVTKSASLPKSDATPAPQQELADKARSVVEMRDTVPVAKGAGEQSTVSASQSVEKRLSPSQVYPDLL